ncbi:hypothetical protein Bca52824_012622 [Brassica carinata]|uniref:Uncharacterized protein n=1 Tax=Brassica carinata TaxID=52824 RepID=A0A8X7VWT6_BRACI|nr:hypothetical protein Bca52824_012622 [Brassica carinata]
MEEEIGNDESLTDDDLMSDSRVDYDIELYNRIGIQCHNLHKGTNFKFKSRKMYRALMFSYVYFDITLEATDPATGSILSFQTLFGDAGRRSSLGVRMLWHNLGSIIKPIRNAELQDDEWDDSTVHDFYKGPMPKWFSDEAMERDSKKYYVMPESELHDNDWLQLLVEVAFFSNADRRLDAYLPLELNSVVVETLEDEPREKLKANNAIYYLSYKCCADPCSTPLAGDHLAIVRKSMDGKPGHLSLEVALTKEQEKKSRHAN